MTARAPPSPQLPWASRTISLGRSSRARRQVTWRPRDIEEWRRLLSTVARRICGRLHLPARGAASIARQTASVRASALGIYPAGGAAVAKPVCPIQRTNTHSVAERARQSTEHRPTDPRSTDPRTLSLLRPGEAVRPWGVWPRWGSHRAALLQWHVPRIAARAIGLT